MASAVKEIRPDRVAIYIRWSTEDQGDGTTLVVQQEGCEHYVLSQGWWITPSLVYIDDGYSGGSLDRPKLNDLRKAIKDGKVDCVVVYKLDRLSRSVMDTVNLVLDEWEGRTYLKSAREPIDTLSPMGKQFFYMLVSYAEWERNIIKERTFSGKMRRAKEGRNPGIPAAYGYRKSDEVGLFEVDEEKAEIVRWVYRKYLEECGAFKIVDELNSSGVPSPTGLKWHKTTVLNMLKNPIYIGRLVYGRRTTNPRRQRDKSEPVYLKGDPVVASTQFPAIISESEFERVQALMGKRHRGATGVRTLASEYLLTGLLRCGCGATMTSHCSRHRSGRLYFYYLCQNKENKGSRACQGGMVPQRLLDGAVESHLKERLKGEASYRHFLAVRQARLEEQQQEARERRRQAAQALEVYDAQMKKLNRDYREGVISPGSYEENRQEIEAERQVLRDRIEELQRLEESLQVEMRQHDSMDDILRLVGRWDELDVSKRKLILRHVLDRVVAFKPIDTGEVSVEVLWRFSEPKPQASC